jgi:hypothetical protein
VSEPSARVAARDPRRTRSRGGEPATPRRLHGEEIDMAGLEDVIDTLSELDRLRDEARDLRDLAMKALVPYAPKRQGWSSEGDLVEKALVQRARRLFVRRGIKPNDQAEAAMVSSELAAALQLTDLPLDKLTAPDEDEVPLFRAPRVMQALACTPGQTLSRVTAFCYYRILRALYTPERPEWTTGGVRAGRGGAATAFVTSECVRAVLALARVLTRTADFLKRVHQWSSSRERTGRSGIDLPPAWQENEKRRSDFALYVDFLHRREDLVIELKVPESPEKVDAAVRDLARSVVAAAGAVDTAIAGAIEDCQAARKAECGAMSAVEEEACKDCDNPHRHRSSPDEDETESGHRRAMRVLRDARAHWGRLSDLVTNRDEINWEAVARLVEEGADRVRRTLRPAEHFVKSVLDRELAIASSDVPQHCDYPELAFAAATYGALRAMNGASRGAWEDVHIQRAAKILAEEMLVDGSYPIGRAIQIKRQGFSLHIVGFEVVRTLAELLRNTRTQFGPEVVHKMMRLFRDTRNPNHQVEGWGHEHMPGEKTSKHWTTALCAIALHRVVQMLDIRINEQVRSHFLVRWPNPKRLTLDGLFIGDHGLVLRAGAVGEKRPSISHYAERMRAHLLDATLAERLWSIVLYGPPGTGKTTIAEALAASAEVPLIEVTPSDLIVAGIEEIEGKARTVMRALSMLTDAVILFDEFDSMLRRRVAKPDVPKNVFELLTPGMLPKLRGLHQAAENHRVVYLLATNRIEDLDDAAIRGGRFDEKVGLYPPDILSRTGRLIAELTTYEARSHKSMPTQLTDDRRERLAKIILRSAGAGMNDVGKPGWFTAPGGPATQNGTPFRWILGQDDKGRGDEPDVLRPEKAYADVSPPTRRDSPHADLEWKEWGLVHGWDEAFKGRVSEHRSNGISLWGEMSSFLAEHLAPSSGFAEPQGAAPAAQPVGDGASHRFYRLVVLIALATACVSRPVDQPAARPQHQTAVKVQKTVEPLTRSVELDALEGITPCEAVRVPPLNEIEGLIYSTALTRSLTYIRDSKQDDYTTLPGNKALASCLEWPASFMEVPNDCAHALRYLQPYTRYYGFSGSKQSVEEAKHTALAECNAARTRLGGANASCSCVVIDENGTKSRDVSTRVSEATTAVAAEVGDIKKRLSRTSTWVVFDDLRNLGHGAAQTDIRLQLAPTIRLGYPDYFNDYDASCLERYWYALKRVENGAVELGKALDDAADGSMTGCYDVSVDVVRNPRGGTHRRLTERVCRYFGTFAPNDMRTNHVEIPDNWPVRADDVVKLWGAGAVRVNEDGLPLKRRVFTEPVAVQTRSDLYLSIRLKSPDPEYGCSISTPLETMLLDATQCGARRDECVAIFMEAYIARLQSELSAPPFGAEIVRNRRLPPGEFWMQRIRRPSLLLGGGNWEQSTYTFETWSDDGEQSPGNSYYLSQLKQGTRGPFVFASLSHIYMVAAHKAGPYVDPPDGGATVAVAIAKVADNSLAVACKKVGIARNRVCIASAASLSSKREHP